MSNRSLNRPALNIPTEADEQVDQVQIVANEVGKLGGFEREQFLALAMWALDQAREDEHREEIELYAPSSAKRIFERLK